MFRFERIKLEKQFKYQKERGEEICTTTKSCKLLNFYMW